MLLLGIRPVGCEIQIWNQGDPAGEGEEATTAVETVGRWCKPWKVGVDGEQFVEDILRVYRNRLLWMDFVAS